eukprot:m.581107 g.581107  ORF g.581107 m.581107 type:complete len:78 (+) comp22326_c1_seq17:247-480(+)
MLPAVRTKVAAQICLISTPVAGAPEDVGDVGDVAEDRVMVDGDAMGTLSLRLPELVPVVQGEAGKRQVDYPSRNMKY